MLLQLLPSGGVDISKVPGCHICFVTTDEFSVRVILLQGLVSHEIATSYLSAFGLILTHEIAILSKVQKPDNFESHNCLKLNFQNLRSNFAECESFLESNSPDILALYETIPG